jgi:hypothetical protein
MLLLLAPAAALLFTCFGLLAGLVQAGAGVNWLDGGFDAGCVTPCFLGVHPGGMPIERAHAALEAHPWVTQLDERMTMDYFGYEHLGFRWQTPGAVTDWPGEVVSSYGAVHSVRLESDVPLVEVWAAFGEPPIVALSAAALGRRQVRLYHTFLGDSSLSAMTILDCPLTLRGVLESRVRALELRRRDIFLPLPDVARTPGLLLRALRTQPRAIC